MSGAPLASPISRQVHLAPARVRRNRLSSLEALERGFALFRSTFGRDAWRYYLGSGPLVICFIPMWVVNGQIRISNGALLLESMLLAAAYLLRVWMVGSYVQKVRQRAFGARTSKSAGLAARAAAVGRLIAWKFMLSVGALATLPTVAGASWFYGACQFASFEAREDGAERHSFFGCLALSSQWFGGCVLFFLMLFPLWIAVWLNGLILAMTVPQLLHSIFGVSTLLSTQMGLFALVQSSSFWLALCGGAWLAVDPVAKCTFVVVYQHLRSRREGDDLRALLASLPREHEKKAQMIASGASGGKVATRALLVLATVLAGISLAANANAAQVPAAQNTVSSQRDAARDARVRQLRTALSEESQRAIYRWHDAEHPEPPTWFDRLLEKIGHVIQRAWDALWDLLRKLWPRGWNLSPETEKPSGWQMKNLRFWLTLIVVLTLTVGAVFFWLRRRKEVESLSSAMAVAPMPDLSDVAAAAERSEDEWFALATRLEDDGELRFALRAAYFGLLAGLAQRQWLTIRRDRTNREYLSEFTRRWRRRPQAATEPRAEIPEKLRGSLRQFDRVWYGAQSVTAQAAAAYRNSQREFLNYV